MSLITCVCTAGPSASAALEMHSILDLARGLLRMRLPSFVFKSAHYHQNANGHYHTILLAKVMTYMYTVVIHFLTMCMYPVNGSSTKLLHIIHWTSETVGIIVRGSTYRQFNGCHDYTSFFGNGWLEKY